MASPRGSPPFKVITNYYGPCENAQSNIILQSVAKRRIVFESNAVPYKKKSTRVVTCGLGDPFYHYRKGYEGDENSQNRTIKQIPIKENNTKQEHSAITKKSMEEDEYDINRLPSEVLCQIFKFLPSYARSNARLVCKKWYDHCQDEKILIKCCKKCNPESLSNIARCLANCNFKHLNLSFDKELASTLSVTLWHKIGSKVRSLECQLATNTMKNIVSYCDNLQHLYLHVSVGDEDNGCSLITTLEDLVNNNAVNRELNTLEITVADRLMYLSSKTIEIWKRIFQAIYQLFPNIITFSFFRCTFRFEDSVKYKCKFSRAKYLFNQVEDSSLASIFADLAFSIFAQDDWLKWLDKLSVIQLNNFELSFCKRTFTSEDETHLRHFFANQNYLTSVCVDFSAWIGAEMLRSVLFEIIENCRYLKRLTYVSPCREKYLTFADFTFLLQKVARVKYVKIGGFSMNRSSVISSMSSTSNSKLSTLELVDVNETTCSCFIRNNYSCLQYLTIRSSITDMILQDIFKYLTELKALDVKLHSSCTNFGITGRHPVPNSSVSTCGYSISRLRNLEKLVIYFEHADNVDDQVVMDFDFPKLRSLHCMKEMKGCEVLLGMASKVPLLGEIKFLCNNMTLVDMINLCQHMKNLYHVHADLRLFNDEVKLMFNSCPRLRMITDFGNRAQYYNSPDSEYIKTILY